MATILYSTVVNKMMLFLLPSAILQNLALSQSNSLPNFRVTLKPG